MEGCNRQEREALQASSGWPSASHGAKSLHPESRTEASLWTAGPWGTPEVLPARVFGFCLVAPLCYPGTPRAPLAWPLPAPECPSLPGRPQQWPVEATRPSPCLAGPLEFTAGAGNGARRLQSSTRKTRQVRQQSWDAHHLVASAVHLSSSWNPAVLDSHQNRH